MDEGDAEDDVDAVQRGLEREPEAGAAEADQPAEDDVVGEREGRRQRPDLPVVAGRRLDRVAAADQAERHGGDHVAEEDDGEADREREDQGAGEPGGGLAPVAGADRLRDQAGGAGAEEIEGDEDDVEDQRADRHAADQRRVAELADHAEVDHADQRRREVGERHRHGDGEHAAMGDLEGADEGGGVHRARRVERRVTGITTGRPDNRQTTWQPALPKPERAFRRAEGEPRRTVAPPILFIRPKSHFFVLRPPTTGRTSPPLHCRPGSMPKRHGGDTHGRGPSGYRPGRRHL